MDVAQVVAERYSEGAKVKQEALCCPVDYNPSLLELLPDEILEKDYGCGDPSRYVREGEVVLDLGSGSGKICYIAAQLVGERGAVIGVDVNQDMLALARKYQSEVANRIGADRVSFVSAQIQDLGLDLDRVDDRLRDHPIKTSEDEQAFGAWCTQQRMHNPAIASESVDLVISNCVLNLVGDDQKGQLVREIYRVLRPGGRIAISDIVSDEIIPEELKEDPELWSGCISGAFQELEFVTTFAQSGFVGVEIDQWGAQPWQVIDDIEFRSVTLTATKSTAGESLDCGHAVIYRGPFSEVRDDEDQVFYRGERMAVSERTYRTLTEGPYADQFIGLAPVNPEPRPWLLPPGARRSVAETKSATHGSGKTSCC